MEPLVQLVMKNYPNVLDFEAAYRYLWPSPNRLAGRRSRWHVAASPHGALSYPLTSARPWDGGHGRPPSLQGWHAGGRSSCCWFPGMPKPTWRRRWVFSGPPAASGPSAFWPSVLKGSRRPPAEAPRGRFPPEVAIHVVRLACERPDPRGRSLSQWDCTELARQLIAEEIIEDISTATIRRILATHQLQPWRQPIWLYPKQPRDAAFYAAVSELIALYTRPLRADALGLSVDEKTSLQPRPRGCPTLPAQPQNLPNRVEHARSTGGGPHALGGL